MRLLVLVLSLSFMMVSVGCKSPREKTLQCQKKCKKLKSKFSRRLCRGMCEGRYYRKIGLSGLVSMCKKGDGIACMRAASKAKKKDGWKGALVYLEIGCKANAAEACGVMGKILSRGKGVKKEVKRGKALMEKGCNLGDAMSCASPGMTLVFDHIFTISEHPPRKVICFQLERKEDIPKTLQGERANV